MVARDHSTGRVTQPVSWRENPDYDKDDGSAKFLPDEPQIGLRATNDEAPEETVQTGFVRGGTTNPPEGSEGLVQQLDNEGNVTDVHPGAVAKAVEEDGIKAGLDLIGGAKTPPGDPAPASEGSGKQKTKKGGK